MDEIATRRRELDHWSMQERKRLLEDFNKEYGVKLRELYKACEENGGHIQGRYHSNGIGWHWFHCSRCGGRIEKTIEKYEI